MLRWSIWLVNLDPVIGSEQGKTRPFLIISDESINELLPVINGLPLTSKKKGRIVYPNEVLLEKGKHGLSMESIVMCYQIRTIDKRRLIRKLGVVDDLEIRESIIDALCFQLGIDTE